MPKKNTVRFTPVQVEAIRSGMNPGLTMVVGPPGTGKCHVLLEAGSKGNGNGWFNCCRNDVLHVRADILVINQSIVTCDFYRPVSSLFVPVRVWVLRTGWHVPPPKNYDERDGGGVLRVSPPPTRVQN